MFEFINGWYEAAATKVKDAIRAAHEWFDGMSPISKSIVAGVVIVAVVAVVAGCAKSDEIGRFADENGQVTLHSAACKDAAVMARVPAEFKDAVKHGEMRPNAAGKKAGLADMDFCYVAMDGLVWLATERGPMPIGPAEMFGMK